MLQYISGRKVRKIELFWRMMNFEERLLSPSGFGLVMICFFLPFLDLKCNDESFKTLKGIELITGSTISNVSLPPVSKDGSKQLSIQPPDQQIERNYFAVAAFLLGLGGLALQFLMRHGKTVFTAVIGFGGGLSLLLMRIQIDNEIQKTTEGLNRYMFRAEYCYGYWIALIAFLIVGASNLFSFIEAKRREIGN